MLFDKVKLQHIHLTHIKLKILFLQVKLEYQLTDLYNHQKI